MNIYWVINGKQTWVVAAEAYAEAVGYCKTVNLAGGEQIIGQLLICGEVREGLTAGIVAHGTLSQEELLVVR